MANDKTRYLPYNFRNGESSTDLTTNNDRSYIEVYHLLTNQAVRFKAFITEFSDDHQSTWSDESVYGRMDDISTFQSTKRIVSIAFEVPSYGIEEAIENMQKMSLLKQFLYPSYKQGGNALTISSSPLVRLKFSNFSVDSSTFNNGLLGKIKNINFSPNLEAGFHSFSRNDKDVDYNVNELSKKVLDTNNIPRYFVPKLFSINISGFNVIHEHSVGWIQNTKQGAERTYVFGSRDEQANTSYYPYGFSTTEGVLNKEQAQKVAESEAVNDALQNASAGILEPT